MISIKNLVKIYNKGKGNEYKALKGIDFQVQDGELVAVIGKSGAGKSTLLHVLAGIDSFESGSYHVGNQDVGQMSEKQLAEFRNKSIGMVMQDFALIEEYTVQENLQVPLIFGKVKKREQSKKIMDVLEKVNIAELKDKRVAAFRAELRRLRLIGRDPAALIAPVSRSAGRTRLAALGAEIIR